MTTRDELRAEKALQGLDFPASKTELIDYATERSATAKTLQTLRTLPDRQFENKDDVVEAVPQEPEGDAPGGVHR
ncbi:DUF2795 domain-containing protein [Brevibacterium linens]|uniref:DUF2795 domain-containing protein n=1 Tax=Brevibacterium linens TaxID=1703 RepID=A0A0B9AX02_BRELN|nr:DUF2795 domain-containing protein [Brevibacterium linens]KHS53851.1 Protein of unknown function DUF2795 [Brevibacterium linens]